jgi:hypothetical protein
MRKKLVLSAMLALLLAVASVSLASATNNDDGDHHDGDHARVINLTATTVQRADIDLGKTGLSLGDRFIFSDDISGDAVGTDGGDCVTVRLDPKDATEANVNAVTQQCVVTLSLPEGQITGQALITFTNAPTPAPFTVAITGGTGKFRTAHGEVEVTEESDTVAHLTVRLIL